MEQIKKFGDFMKNATGNALRVFDQDHFKSSVEPKRDWGMLVVLFILLSVAFLSFGLYTFLETGRLESVSAPKAFDPSGEVTIEKIKTGAAALVEIEKSFAELRGNKPAIVDPSR